MQKTTQIMVFCILEIIFRNKKIIRNTQLYCSNKQLSKYMPLNSAYHKLEQ